MLSLTPSSHRQTPGQPNIFTITPRSADAMMVIGRAKDLGSCQARKASGDLCGDWCDAYVVKSIFVVEAKADLSLLAESIDTAPTTSNELSAVPKRQGPRLPTRRSSLALRLPPPLTPVAKHSSSSMSNTAVFDKKKYLMSLQKGGKSNYNPDKKTGLLPDSRRAQVAEGLTTYVSAGTGGGMRNGKHQVVTSAALRAAAIQSGNGSGGFVRGVRDGPTAEKLEKERREKERMEKRRKEEVKALMGQDKGRSVGGEYVELANKQRKEKEKAERKKREEEERAGVVAKGKKKRKVQSESESSEEEENDENETGDKGKKKKRAFTTAAVRLIGYDPTNHKDAEDEETKRLRVCHPSVLGAEHIADPSLRSRSSRPSPPSPPTGHLPSSPPLPVPKSVLASALLPQRPNPRPFSRRTRSSPT